MTSARLSRIPYITLWVKNFDACVNFYRELLELPVEHIEENFAQFDTQGTRLYLHRLGDAPPLRKHSVEIHFDVPDVDAAYKNLLDKGIKFEQAPANMPWGSRMASFRDPEGFSLEIVGPIVSD